MKRLLVIQHLEIEGPGLFYQIAKDRGMKVKIIRLDIGNVLPETRKDDLLLIMGGPMGVRDIGSAKYPWLRIERDFIKSELNKKTRIIGVCLGAQLLANAAGGNVENLNYGSPPKDLPEIGWSQVFFNKSNNEFKQFCKTTFHALHWHADRILLPENAVLIASSKNCKEQFFKIGDLAFGLQFHIELEKGMLEKWINKDKIFINKGLGQKGEAILIEEDKKFREKTISKRKLLINTLFNLLSNK